MRHFCIAVCLALASPAHTQNEVPLSAIDWLSLPGLAPLTEELVEPSLKSSDDTMTNITVTELALTETKSYGLIPAKISGIPKDFWTDLEPNMLGQLLGSLSTAGLPTTNELLLRALLAETDGNEAVLTARVQALLDRGAVHAAISLLEQSGINTPATFSLHSQSALLIGNNKRMCQFLISKPYLSKDEALKIYCLAREGDWGLAVLTYFTLDALNTFNPTISALLKVDLDPELIGELSLAPTVSMKLSELEFRLRESAGKRPPTQGLPLRFAYMDLSETTGWKQQLEAAEKLAIMSTLPANKLLEYYLKGSPSATGGIWERVRTVQSLDETFSDPILDPTQDLEKFWVATENTHLAPVFARAWSDKLSSYQVSETGDHTLFKMQILSGGSHVSFLEAMERLHHQNPKILSKTYTNLLTQFEDKNISPIPFRSSSVLRAIRLVEDAMEGNEPALYEAIMLIRCMGLTPMAEQLALDFMILAKI